MTSFPLDTREVTHWRSLLIILFERSEYTNFFFINALDLDFFLPYIDTAVLSLTEALYSMTVRS